MRAELVMIGSELLLGQVVDTNSSFLAKRLAELGVDLFRKTTVGDNLGRIADVLRDACERAELVVVSGGLGPTEDDLTREAVARCFDVDLVFHQELLDEIQCRFNRFGRKMSPNNRRQAHLPEGATVLPNPIGTAPAFVLEAGTNILVTLPGVPAELKLIFDEHFVPYLQEKGYVTGEIIRSRVLKICGAGESTVDSEVGDLLRSSQNPTVGILASPGAVTLRITAKAASDEEVRRMIDQMESEIRERIGWMIFGGDDETLEGVVDNLLVERGLTLAVAESVSGGFIAQRFCACSAESVLGSYVSARGNEIRGIPDTLVAPGTAQDIQPADVATSLADAVRGQLGADIGLATVQGTDCSFVACSGKLAKTVKLGYFGRGVRAQQLIATASLEMLRRLLVGAPT